MNESYRYLDSKEQLHIDLSQRIASVVQSTMTCGSLVVRLPTEVCRGGLRDCCGVENHSYKHN